MVRYLGLIALIFGLNACVVDQKLTMVQQPNDSNVLRLDGIYLHEDSLGIVDLLYLYKDGTLLSRGSVPKHQLKTKLIQLENGSDKKFKKMKFLWGRYTVEGQKIKFEKWGTSDKNYVTFTKEGHIVNDKSFQLGTYYLTKGKVRRKIDEIYRFRPMSSKPDSTNRWLNQ